MGIQIHQLPTSGIIPSDAYMIIKRDVNGQKLDYKIDLNSLLSPYVNRADEVGTDAGKLFTLIDIDGSPALPALDGSLLTNLATVTATDQISGNVRLSDELDSANGIGSGRAATPKAVRDMGALKLNLTGGNLSGDLTFNNSVSLVSKLSGGTAVKLFQLTGSDKFNIGPSTGTPISSVNINSSSTVSINDGTGTPKFTFNTSSGDISGFKASGITASATSTTSAGSVQGALSSLASSKLETNGGTLNGTLAFSGTNKATFSGYPIYYNSGNAALSLGDATTKPTNTDLTQSSTVRLRNSTGVVKFSFNVSNGTSTGIKAVDTSFTPSGGISASNLQAAIAELDSEKLATNATAYDSSRLGGVLASNYLTTSTANSSYLGTNGTAYNADRLGGTTAANYKTLAQNNALYLGINSTAYDSSRLGGVLSSNFRTVTQNNALYLGISATASDSNKLRGIAASNFLTQAQCDARYLAVEGTTVDNAFNLGGIPASSYLQISDADDDYLAKTATASDSTRLGGVLSSNYLTTAQGNSLYLTVGGTAANSNSLAGVAASNYVRKDQANTLTGALTVNNTITPNKLSLTDNKVLSFGNSDDVNIAYSPTTKYLEMDLRTVTGTDVTGFKITRLGADRFTFDKDTGDFTAIGNVSANSDRRIKTDFKVIDDALTKVSMLTGLTYERTDISMPRQTGLIAQEVQEVLPEAVTEDSNGLLSVAYGNLVGLLVEAIKDLKDEVEILKRRN